MSIVVLAALFVLADIVVCVTVMILAVAGAPTRVLTVGAYVAVALAGGAVGLLIATR